MPRKQRPSIEERIEQSKIQQLKNEERKRYKLANLKSSFIYKASRKSCVVFLWIAQFILIDWLLPYRQAGDCIKDGFSLDNEYSLGIYQSGYRQTEITINTQKEHTYHIEFTGEEGQRPAINDSIIVYRSYLLRDVKKIGVPRVGESFLVTTSVTYSYLPLLIIVSGLAALFLFIRNIEVKSFYYFMLTLTLGSALFLLFCLFLPFIH